MKFTINPKFKHLELYIRTIPQQFSQAGELIYKDNDEVREFNFEDNEVIVKQYKLPHNIFKRIFYYHFRSKAKRAYNHALNLQKRGFETPTPIAHIASAKLGMINQNFYVTCKCSYTRDLREFGDGMIEGKEEILKAFGRLLASLHESEILLEQFSPGNITFAETKSGVRFSLLNIVHLKYTHIGRNKGIKSFKNISGSEEMVSIIFREYARMREFDPDKHIPKMLRYRRRYLARMERMENRELNYFLRLKRKKRD